MPAALADMEAPSAGGDGEAAGLGGKGEGELEIGTSAIFAVGSIKRV
jgi:hypothetical protein